MITSEQIKELERKREQAGITKLHLMENAARGIYKVLNERFELKNKKILIVCYHGNNGGDGFAAAGHLCDIAEVDVLFIGEESKLTEEARVNYKRILHNEKIQFIEDDEAVDFDDFDIILDSILGIGYQGYLRSEIADVIGRINASKAVKVAIDIPTGINSDTGEKAEKFVDAELIITFHDLKPGLSSMTDKTVVVDIGLSDVTNKKQMP